MDKVEYYKICIQILKKIYKKRIIINELQNKYEIIIDKKSDLIETKYEIKKLFRNILSSNNSNINSDITNIIEVRYKLKEPELKILNEMYPNVDVFIAAFIKNSNPIIEMDNYNYEQLLEYFVKKTISELQNTELKIEYEKNNKQKKQLEQKLDKLEIQLNKYQIAMKNRFYYETYRDSLFEEMDNYNQEKEIISATINLNNQQLNKQKKQYQKLEMVNQLSKRTNIKRLNKINDIMKNIDYLEKDIRENNLKLKELENKNKSNIARNNEVFRKYINMNINEYSLIYEQNKNADGIKIINEIKKIKDELTIIEDKLKKNDYPICYRKLRYFCLDNLKIYKKITDINPKISKNIISLLESNSNELV